VFATSLDNNCEEEDGSGAEEDQEGEAEVDVRDLSSRSVLLLLLHFFHLSHHSLIVHSFTDSPTHHS